MHIRCPGGKLAGKTLKVLEHEIRFAENGLAEAAHLTDEEVQRLVRFGFHVVHPSAPEPKPAAIPQKPAEPVQEDEPPAVPPVPAAPQGATQTIRRVQPQGR